MMLSSLRARPGDMPRTDSQDEIRTRRASVPQDSGQVYQRWGSRVLLLAPILWALAGCSDGGSARGGESSKPLSPPVVQVDAEVVQPQALVWPIPIVGTLTAAEETAISTKAAGILRGTFVDVGTVVAPGEPLAQVDPSDYEVAAEQAGASLAEVLARLGVDDVPNEAFDLNQVSAVRRAAAELDNARFTYDRLIALGTVASAQELNDATTQVRIAEANHLLELDEAAALVATARERFLLQRMAKQKLSETLIKTPPIPTTRGERGSDRWVVSARLVTEGQYVRVGDPLYRLLVTDPLKLRSKVPERYADQARVGQPVELVGGSGSPPLQGRIVRISPSVESASRTFEIEALIDNESKAMMPGTFATGAIVPDGTGLGIYVTHEAVVTTGGATRVFVIENGIARQRIIQAGRQEEGLVEVKSGLSAGEQIISRGASVITDGTVVQVRAKAAP